MLAKENQNSMLPQELEVTVYRELNEDLKFLSNLQLEQHYQMYGRDEGRISNSLRDRTDFIGLIDKTASALEIGPFVNPILSGPFVKYADVLSTKQLRERAEALKINTSRLPSIDYVLKSDGLASIRETFKHIVSSHNIEHQPDFILHLQQLSAVLQRNSGQVFLMIPDRRYCFDAAFPDSTIAEIIDAHQERRTTHTLNNVIKHLACTVHNDPQTHWALREQMTVKSRPSSAMIQNAMNVFKAANGGYVDVHAWMFTPQSFEQIMVTLYELGYTDLVPERIYSARFGQNEFWVILKHG